jgi:hypothetical protein
LNYYELRRQATPRPDNPGNSKRCIEANKRLDAHAARHFYSALKLLMGCLDFFEDHCPRTVPGQAVNLQVLREAIEEFEQVNL